MERPQIDRESIITTPASEMSIKLLGKGVAAGPVALTTDEFNAIRKVYGYTKEESVLLQAGADRNAIREASVDGLRLLAWLARFVEPGQDPLKALVQIADAAGLDVSAEDFEWADP